MKSSNEKIAEIAQYYLGVETLETRNSDSLDFHEVSVGALNAALTAAYAAGIERGKAYRAYA